MTKGAPDCSQFFVHWERLPFLCGRCYLLLGRWSGRSSATGGCRRCCLTGWRSGTPWRGCRFFLRFLFLVVIGRWSFLFLFVRWRFLFIVIGRRCFFIVIRWRYFFILVSKRQLFLIIGGQYVYFLFILIYWRTFATWCFIRGCFGSATRLLFFLVTPAFAWPTKVRALLIFFVVNRDDDAQGGTGHVSRVKSYRAPGGAASDAACAR